MSLQGAIQASKRSVATSLRAVVHPLSSTSADSSSATLPTLLPGLPESLSQLLSQLRQQVTALSLAFKPPITVPAAVAQLTKVEDAYGRIAACVVAGSAGVKAGSSILIEEWAQGAEEIGTEVQRLLEVFETAVTNSEASGSRVEENPYLHHTGLVWDAIDRLSTDLSTSEVTALGKRWKSQSEVMKDAWSEFKEFLEEQEDEDEDGEDGNELDLGDDDGFEELDDIFTGGKKMTPEERARAEAAKPLLGLHQILHSTIPRYLPLLVLSPEETYRGILEAGNTLVGSFDSAISAMYPEHDEEEIERTIQDLNTRSRDLAKTIRERLGRGEGEEGKREACRSFLTKWEDRLGKELEGWTDRTLSLASLRHAL